MPFDPEIQKRSSRKAMQMQGGCPLNGKEGKSSIGKSKGLCPSLHQKSSLGEEGKSSTEEGKDLCPSLYQKSSWLGYHGTSITSAIVAVCTNSLNKSERVFGDPAPNDKEHGPTKKG